MATTAQIKRVISTINKSTIDGIFIDTLEYVVCTHSAAKTIEVHTDEYTEQIKHRCTRCGRVVAVEA